MSHFALELPTIQNWSCHSCSECCKQHGIFVTPEDKERIERQQWSEADGIAAGQPLFVKEGGWLGKSWYRLAQPGGACVFLNEEGLCRIHAKYGEAAKPIACRIYPYTFHPAGKKVTVSLRFSCPSVVRNAGRPVAEQRKDLRQLVRQVVPTNVTQAQPPEISAGTRLDWPDVLRFVEALDRTMAADEAVLVKLQRALSWMRLVEQSKFDAIGGERLREFLEIVTQAAVEGVGQKSAVGGQGSGVRGQESGLGAEPSRIGRMQFRLLAGQYARKDTYASDRSAKGRMRLLWAAVRLARGRGTAPPVQDCFREVPFEALEQPFGALPAESDQIFTRYFRVKIQGLHFFGRPFYGVPLVQGFYSLALVYPVVLWIARWLAAGDGRTSLSEDDVVRATTIADHNHGYSPALGTWGFRRRVQNLAQLGDIAKLCAWYSR